MSKRKRMFFRAAHRDAAEKVIITALRSVGASVYQVSGKDIPDLLVGFRGVTTLLEVKSRILTEDKGRKPRVRETRVSDGQKDFMATWQGGPALVVFTPEAALMAIGAPFEGPAASATESPRFLAVNGAFLCEQCWLPENGLHAKDCPTRQALKRPAKVKSAYRAAKEAQAVLPKTVARVYDRDMNLVHEQEVPAGTTHVTLRASRGVEGELQPLELCKCGCPHGTHSGTYGSGECTRCGWRHCERYREGWK